MHIIDLEGRVIDITDLEASLSMVRLYLSFKDQDQNPSVQRFIARRKQYWQDFLEKLLQLQINLNLPDNENDMDKYSA